MSPSKLHARLVSAGFGGVGPATPAPAPDAWVVAIVDVDTTGSLSGVAIAEIELLDPAGNVVARGVPPWSAHSGSGTLPFDGNARPGENLRLQVRATLDARLESLTTSGPVRFRARLIAASDPGLRIEGPLDPPWATAGPVGPR